jgi:hypothetical protein
VLSPRIEDVLLKVLLEVDVPLSRDLGIFVSKKDKAVSVKTMWPYAAAHKRHVDI